jgi:hypothetical protein
MNLNRTGPVVAGGGLMALAAAHPWVALGLGACWALVAVARTAPDILREAAGFVEALRRSRRPPEAEERPPAPRPPPRGNTRPGRARGRGRQAPATSDG